MSGLILNGDTSGSVTINVPAVAGSSTVTLPSQTGNIPVLPTGYALGGGDTTRFKNRIINGDMRINQRGNPATVNGTQIFVSDRWRTGSNATSGWVSGAALSSSQSTDAPNGFVNSTLLTVTSAATPSGNVGATLVHPIEGVNIADLGQGTANAKTVTLSFWVKSSLTGTFSGMLASAGTATRGYLFTYTITSANTWEQKTITVPGDTGGTANWLTNTGVGMFVRFSLGAAGTTLSSTTNSWFTFTVEDGVTGQTNLVATNGATWRLTGVQLEVGSQATSFEYVDYGTQLLMCQRYYLKSYDMGTVPGTAADAGRLVTYASDTNAPILIRYPVAMRTGATITIYSTYNGASGVAREGGSTTNKAVTVLSPGESGSAAGLLGTASATNYYYYQYAVSAEL